jgi:hypothetical protein
VKYGELYEQETLTRFWPDVWFIDEIHLQSFKLQNKAEYELRFPGQEQHLKETKTTGHDVTIHCAAGIYYNRRGKLHLYKNSNEPSKKAYKPRMPRKTMYQSDLQY